MSSRTAEGDRKFVLQILSSLSDAAVTPPVKTLTGKLLVGYLRFELQPFHLTLLQFESQSETKGTNINLVV